MTDNLQFISYWPYGDLGDDPDGDIEGYDGGMEVHDGGD